MEPPNILERKGSLLPKSIRNIRKSRIFSSLLEILDIETSIMTFDQVRRCIKEKACVILQMPWTKDDLERFQSQLKFSNPILWNHPYILTLDNSEDSERAMEYAISNLKDTNIQVMVACLPKKIESKYRRNERLILNYYLETAAKQAASRYLVRLQEAGLEGYQVVRAVKSPEQEVGRLASETRAKAVVVGLEGVSSKWSKKRKLSGQRCRYVIV